MVQFKKVILRTFLHLNLVLLLKCNCRILVGALENSSVNSSVVLNFVNNDGAQVSNFSKLVYKIIPLNISALINNNQTTQIFPTTNNSILYPFNNNNKARDNVKYKLMQHVTFNPFNDDETTTNKEKQISYPYPFDMTTSASAEAAEEDEAQTRHKIIAQLSQLIKLIEDLDEAKIESIFGKSGGAGCSKEEVSNKHKSVKVNLNISSKQINFCFQKHGGINKTEANRFGLQQHETQHQPQIIIHINLEAENSESNSSSSHSHEVVADFLPLWLQLCIIFILLCLCGLMSGLNLGLMSITKTELEITINTGSRAEHDYALKIQPVRLKGNQLLCCLILSNVLINATLATLVDRIISGYFSIVITTMVIVIIGEIIPQAICMRHGLYISAKTIYITRFFMIITSPLSYPLGKLLDLLLGDEIGPVYTRERLKELLRITKIYNGLSQVQLGLIYEALDLQIRRVKNITKPLQKVFMLSIDAQLDYETMKQIQYNGYSYIPIYEKDANNILGVLSVKQLILVVLHDKKLNVRQIIEKHCDCFSPAMLHVSENTALDYMLKEFIKQRHFPHRRIALVHRIIPNVGHHDKKVLGIITLADILRQILQSHHIIAKNG